MAVSSWQRDHGRWVSTTFLGALRFHTSTHLDFLPGRCQRRIGGRRLGATLVSDARLGCMQILDAALGILPRALVVLNLRIHQGCGSVATLRVESSRLVCGSNRPSLVCAARSSSLHVPAGISYPAMCPCGAAVGLSVGPTLVSCPTVSRRTHAVPHLCKDVPVRPAQQHAPHTLPSTSMRLKVATESRPQHAGAPHPTLPHLLPQHVQLSVGTPQHRHLSMQALNLFGRGTSQLLRQRLPFALQRLRRSYSCLHM